MDDKATSKQYADQKLIFYIPFPLLPGKLLKLTNKF